MDILITFFIGFGCGLFVGALLTALCAAAGREKRDK